MFHFTGSVIGSKGNIGQTAYSASKAGMEGFTKSLAKEVATKGITANVIAPGNTYVSLRLRVQNGISRLISALCVNCLISIPEYSRIRLRVQNGISCLISALCVNCLISILEYSRLNHLDVHLV